MPRYAAISDELAVQALATVESCDWYEQGLSSHMTPMHVQPVVLEDERVRLEPLAPMHANDILECIEPETFEYMPTAPSGASLPAVLDYIDTLTGFDHHLAFAVIDRRSGLPIGTTSYCNIRAEHRGLEIGYTWLTSPSRGTGINTRMKRLLLTHAFDALGAIRVELQTDALNKRSRRAIEKLGTVHEGVLGAHIVMPNGRLRDTAVYAITADRWDEVRRSHGWA